MRTRRLIVVPVAALLVGAMATPMVGAQDSPSGSLVHRESVLTELSPTGAPGTSRVFTQLTIPAGTGEVVLPGQATDGLRGLSGPGPARDGEDLRFTSDGAASVRTVADHTTADLPVSIEVRYAVDGEQVEPEDVIGHDGEVAVTYVVRNLTARPTELMLVDGDGTQVAETVDVAVPMVGSLALTLPNAFTGVTAPGAVVVGDGRGGTVVNWSLLLFAPLGSETQEVTWTARARDAVVPAASLQVLPVTPDSFGSLGSTEAAYGGAVDSTTELTEGAREIDANLRRLVDGAGRLLDGLTQLRDGAGQLTTGLVAAASGAGELSDGLGKARAGAGDLSTGLGELSSGAGRLAGGAESARAGATDLSAGLGDLSAGATALSEGLSQADEGGNQLATGLGQLSTGAGDLAAGAGDLADGATTLDTKTGELTAGADAVSSGATQVLAGIQLLSDQLTGPEGLPVAIAATQQMISGIGSTSPGATILYGLDQLKINLAGLQLQAAGIVALAGAADAAIAGVVTDLGNLPVDPVLTTAIAELEAVRGTLATANPNITALGTSISGALAGPLAGLLATVTGGVSNPGAFAGNPLCQPTDVAADKCGLLQGLQVLEGGLSGSLDELSAKLGSTDVPGETLLYGAGQLAGGSAQLAAGAQQLRTDGTAPLAAGAGQVSEGASQLAAGAAAAAAGGEDLTDGLGRLAGGGVELSAGAARAAAGSTALATGLGELDAGADALADGASRATDGSVELGNGLVQLDDGGAALADGLVAARKGSRDLFSGLTMAAGGGTQVADGSEQLAEEGTAVLAGTVSEATISSSRQLEQVRAVAARGIAGDGLPYPTTEGAVASAVYQFDLAGVGRTDGPGAGGRVALGLLALALAAGAGLLARRRVPAFGDADVAAPEHVEV